MSGEFERATTLNTQAIVLAGKTPTMAQAFGIISLYLSGRPREAVELGRESVRVARGAHNTRSRAVQFATAVTRPVLPLQGRVAKTHRADRVTRRVVNPAKRYGSMMITGSEFPDAFLPSTLTSYSTAMSAFLGVFSLDVDFGETFSLFIVSLESILGNSPESVGVVDRVDQLQPVVPAQHHNWRVHLVTVDETRVLVYVHQSLPLAEAHAKRERRLALPFAQHPHRIELSGTMGWKPRGHDAHRDEHGSRAGKRHRIARFQLKQQRLHEARRGTKPRGSRLSDANVWRNNAAATTSANETAICATTKSSFA